MLNFTPPAPIAATGSAAAQSRRYHLRAMSLVLSPLAPLFPRHLLGAELLQRRQGTAISPRLPAFSLSSSSSPAAAAPAEEEGCEEGKSTLPGGLRRESLPRHVAVIMDGNSRWARARGLPVSAGHEAGYRALREMVELSASWGVRVLTVFAFSSENWLRPRAEVDFLIRLFEGVLRENLEDFLRRGIRLSIIGDSTKLPRSLQDLANEAEQVTRHNSHLELIVALSYSGRSDIVQACQNVALKVKDGVLDPADITEAVIAGELQTNCISKFPYPDLLIRTSGELRLSNFLLWQSAYTELFFADALWPDFGESGYIEALLSFQQRCRRFGRRVFDT